MAGHVDTPTRLQAVAGRRSRMRAREQGIALILVLWVVALLTIIAVGLTASQRTESTLAANQVATVRFRGLAEAGINYAVINLLAQPPLVEGEGLVDDLWVPDGSPRLWSFAGQTLQIAIVNEGSLIDLNSAGKDLLSALLIAAGIPEGEDEPLVDAILDWRDEDDLHLLNGAEDPDYAAAGLTYGAKDGPFDSVDELRQVLGFDRDLYRTLAPVLTVDAGTDRVDREFAPTLVLAALDGITLEEAELRLDEQRAAEELIPGGQPVRPLSRGGPLYRIRVSRGGDMGPFLSMEALVNIEPGSSPPFRIRWRRYGLAANTPVTDEEASEP
jgi:general secretion pathway protein K